MPPRRLLCCIVLRVNYKVDSLFSNYTKGFKCALSLVMEQWVSHIRQAHRASYTQHNLMPPQHTPPTPPIVHTATVSAARAEADEWQC